MRRIPSDGGIEMFEAKTDFSRGDTGLSEWEVFLNFALYPLFGVPVIIAP